MLNNELSPLFFRPGKLLYRMTTTSFTLKKLDLLNKAIVWDFPNYFIPDFKPFSGIFPIAKITVTSKI